MPILQYLLNYVVLNLVDSKAKVCLSLVLLALSTGLWTIDGLAVNAFGPFVDAGAKDSQIFVIIVDYCWSFLYQSTCIDRFYDFYAINILFLAYFCWRIEVP